MTQDMAWDRSELQTHATHLDGLTTTTQGIADRANQTGVGSDKMYGLLHSHTLKPVLEWATTSQRGAFNELTTFCSKRATAIQGAVNDYSAVEADNIAKAGTITRDLGSK